MPKRAKRIRAVLTPLALAFATASATAQAETERETLAYLVKQDCGSCHGLTLKGGLGRPLTKEALDHFDVETVRAIILDGLPGTPMPPWRPLLSVEQAGVIADMLKKGEIR